MSRFRAIGIAVAVLGSFVGELAAAPHIGMKLACKRYGDAWNSGSRHALMSTTTGDFASVWARVPPEVFATLPRGGGSQVIGSSKGRGSGTVTVATSQGVITFVLVGKGFNWIVTDILKRGDDGRTISLKSYMDVSLTTHEFMNDLKRYGGTRFYHATSNRFRSHFARLSHDELTRVRGFLPYPKIQGQPTVRIHGSRATVATRVPDTGDRIVFHMVREGKWRVDDFEIRGASVDIASFQSAMPAIASMSAFGDFAANPKSMDPRTFTTAGPLQDELLFAQTLTESPFPPPAPRQKFEVNRTGDMVTVCYADRCVRVRTCPMGSDCGKLMCVEVGDGRNFNELSKLLAMKRQVASLSTMSGFAWLRGGDAAKGANKASRDADRPADLPTLVAAKPAPMKDAVAADEESTRFTSAEEPVTPSGPSTPSSPKVVAVTGSAPASTPSPAPAIVVDSSQVRHAAAVTVGPAPIRRVHYVQQAPRIVRQPVVHREVKRRGGLFRRGR